MRADAPLFTSSATMGDPEPHLDESLNDALLKALVSEKGRHRAAKLAVEAAQAKIICLSAENKTLKASKILLEAVVKKNRIRTSVPSTEEPAQYPLQESILYDALAQQRTNYETKGYPEDNKQDHRLFDLSLVSPASREDAIFRHFLDDGTVKDTSPESPPPPTRQDTDERRASLIDVSPPSQPTTFKPKHTPTVAEAVESCHSALESAIMNQLTVNMDNPPTMQLPADFLAKYRPAKKTPVVIVEVSPEEHAPVQNNFHCPAKATPVTVTVLEEPPEKVVPVQTNILPNGGFAGAVRVPLLDTKIKWAMNSLMPAFDNEDQIRHARQNCAQLERASYFWRYPVRFLPNPTEKNLYRTVMIDYIPRNATYQDVLEHVRTGALESIQMFPPLRGCVDFFTARVVFTYEIPAVSMVMQYQKKTSQGDPIKIKDCVVRFWQVLEPTYPANKQLEDDIFQGGYTRILLLENVENSGVLPKLHEKMAQEIQNGSVIKIWRTTDGVPMVEFTSVAAAAGAYRRLKGDREFKDCIFDFERDYCEDDY